MARQPKSWTVKANIGKNRLYINLSGRMTAKDAKDLYTEVRFCVADLKPEFHIITDLTKSSFGSLSTLPTVRKIIHFFISNHVSEVVRIVDTESVYYKQIINFTMRSQGYKPIYAASLEEAERKLDESTQRKGLRLMLHSPPVQIVFEDKETQEGKLTNISVSGCAVKSPNLKPQKDQTLQLKFKLSEDKENSVTFDIKARIARIDENGFAAQFQSLDEESQDKLWKCIANESQCELKDGPETIDD